jgi:hypothetical protein
LLVIKIYRPEFLEDYGQGLENIFSAKSWPAWPSHDIFWMRDWLPEAIEIVEPASSGADTSLILLRPELEEACALTYEQLKTDALDALVTDYLDDQPNIDWNPGPMGGGIGPILQGELGSLVADFVAGGSIVGDQIVELAQNENAMKHLTHNFHQFFYKNLAQKLVDELKGTPEFRLMYDHLFPMKRYMALSFAYTGDSLSRFVPDPTDILDITKDTLYQVMAQLESSLDFTYLPDPLASFLTDQLNMDVTSTQGRQPTSSKMIIWIILRTTLLILKGLVELIDPAIIIAKAIVDTSNAIQQAVIATLETALNTAKMAITAARDIAYSTVKMVEINISILSVTLSALVNGPLSPLKDIDITDPDDPSVTRKLNTYITFNVVDDPTPNDWNSGDEEPLLIEDYEIAVEPLADASYQALTDQERGQWDDITSEVQKAKVLQEDYIKAKAKLDELDNTLDTEIADMQKALDDAKRIMKEIYTSPYLLPGVWTALLPSRIPLGGGLGIPPWTPGPPSTVLGMIYLALMFLDGWEEEQHRQSQLTSADEEDPNCEEYL